MFSKRDVSTVAPQKMRRFLMFTVPSLVLLGLLSLTGWRWWRKRVRRPTSVDHSTALVSVQHSPSISEDSGVNVVDGAQVEEKSCKENLTVASGGNAELTNKPHWKYPTASSDVNSETMSEVGSLCSSEEVFSETQHFEMSTFTPGISKAKKVAVSQSTSCVEDRPSHAMQMLKSLSTPNLGPINWPNRKRVMIQLPRDMVGRFIGKQGRNIKSLMAEADGAHVYVNQKNLPKDALIVPCTVQGTCEQVEKALKIIAIRYPELDLPGQLDKSINNQQPFPSPLFGTPRLNGESWNTTLAAAQIPSSPFKAMVTYIESLSRLWIVPYNKSAELDEQHQSMSYTYCYAVATGNDTTYASEGDDSLLKKFCAVRVSDIHWLRGQMAKLNDEGSNYEVLLVDYGSTVMVPHTAIRPLRREHTTLPIQAFPCELANVIPNDAMSEDGLMSLQTLVEGMVLEVHITELPAAPLTPGKDTPGKDPTIVIKIEGEEDMTEAMTEGGTTDPLSKEPHEENIVLKWFHIEPAPLVELYTRFGSDSPLFINRELVERGFAIWKEGPLANES